ncbi:hypothetical protein ONE63_003381 [Megalurothrips usitatus]|uniref:Macro domain-containing protein n=1 Tax=Megalurothrips usitatus TaxID=439358 RepID=A0AAV7XE55_9NEOP|nr:hypothetical protein ONE63_003381 [Megalurothrips usitatus]
MAPVVELWGDLLAMPGALAHAVSSDFHMSAGIAVDFKKCFGRVDELLAQGKGVGEVAYLKHKSTYVFYLITKKHYSNKCISLNNVFSCLVHLNHLCTSLGVREVSMPRIGCGLDLLKYSDILPRVCAAFQDSYVQVNILTPPPSIQGLSVLGDGQGVRYLISRGKLANGMGIELHLKTVGLSRSGQTISQLLDVLNGMPNNSLGDVLVLIGTNDFMKLCSSDEKQRRERKAIRGKWSALRTVLSNKCKACCRAIITTVPPIPKILNPAHSVATKEHWLWNYINQSLKDLSASRFHVLDLEAVFMKDGIGNEDFFER